MVHLGPKKPPSRKGSMSEISKDILEHVHELEKEFTVDTASLKKITDHFVSELAKGLTKEGGSIVSI